MKYTEASIELLLERLLSKSMKDGTPKKYAGDMFSAFEVIRQLQGELNAAGKGDRLATDCCVEGVSCDG